MLPDVTVRLIVVLCVSEPETPVIVTVDVPVVAVALAVSVSALVVVVLAGLNDAVTPLGKPDADRLTLLANPPDLLTVTVLEPLELRAMLSVDGAAESEKSGVAVVDTVRLTDVVCVSEPETPVIVTDALAVKVTVLVVVALAGLNDAVTPLGRPDADSATLLLKPLTLPIVTVLEPLPLCAMDTLLGDADSEKSGVAVDPPASAVTSAAPFGLPQPVTRSNPATALKPAPLPAVGLLLPLVTSWKSLL